MTAPLYTRDILRLAASIPGLVRFEELEDGVERRSPTCGSRMKAMAELDGEGRVVSVRQAVEACAFGQAAAALMASHAAGRNTGEVSEAIAGIEAWLGGDDQAATSWPGLSAIEPVRSRKGRHGAVMLPFRTLLAAMEEAR